MKNVILLFFWCTVKHARALLPSNRVTLSQIQTSCKQVHLQLEFLGLSHEKKLKKRGNRPGLKEIGTRLGLNLAQKNRIKCWSTAKKLAMAAEQISFTHRVCYAAHTKVTGRQACGGDLWEAGTASWRKNKQKTKCNSGLVIWELVI